jgi:hypothetical protein
MEEDKYKVETKIEIFNIDSKICTLVCEVFLN